MNAPLPKSALDTIELELGGAKIIIPTRAIAKALLERMLAGAVQATVGVPNIGERWEGQGGWYAGTVRGEEGVPDHHLIVYGNEAEGVTWQAALDYAKAIECDGHHDFTLPTRREQAILFGNVKDLFTDNFYWSSEQHAEPSEYAWGQFFGDGDQGFYRQGYKGRARAVRRLPIQ